MDDLQEKLRNTKGLGERFITAHRDMMRGYSAVDKLIDDIEQIASDLNGIVDVWKKKELGQEIQSQPDDELEKTAMEGYLHQQPETMSSAMSLKGYQIFGVNWMLLLYRRQLSGILADEMGLGKTAQVIGFLAQLVSQGNVGPHLIIVPSSTLENWLREFQKFCPSLDVRSYYGNQRERTELQYDLRKDRSWPVLVTTYQMATGSKMDIKFLKYLKFDVTILDEGHMVKNCTSARYHSLMSIPSSFRLLLTGTPLQNNLQELVSLLTFILPSMFKENEEELQKIFKIKYTSNTVKDQGDLNSSETKAQAGSTNIAQMLSMERIKRAKRMMTPFVLRRQKSQVYNDLPKKLHVLKRCPMTERQLKVYKKVVEDSRKSLDIPETKSGDDNSGTISAEVLDLATPNRTDLKTPKSSNILMALRKAAIHPLLQRSLYTDEMLRKMAKTIMRVSTLLKYCEGLGTKI
jgi:SWI/SNF-related matrix-associated actin-dependent regulator 1 of chromatin subfamily A